MTDTLVAQIARRIRSRREKLKLSQEDLAARMGLKHRQTLTSIEIGERRIQPAELVSVAKALGVGLDYFTDPYSAAGEATFSFRAEAMEPDQLKEFEDRAGDWLATYRALCQPSFLKKALSLSETSSYEQALDAGEQTARELKLGRYPANGLQDALGRDWGILVMYVDLPDGISGAASRLEGLQAILLNRNQSPARRNYTLAHELFHLLTWDTMPPKYIDTEKARGGANRVETLANNFASALLMPLDTIRASWSTLTQVSLPDRIAVMAEEFRVSAPALKWRLWNVGLVPKAERPEDSHLSNVTPAAGREDVKPLLFNVEFVRRLHGAVEEGTLSVRKATRILGTDTAGFADLCRSYGRQLSFET